MHCIVCIVAIYKFRLITAQVLGSSGSRGLRFAHLDIIWRVDVSSSVKYGEEAVWHQAAESINENEDQAVRHFAPVLNGRRQVDQPEVPNQGRVGRQQHSEW